MRVTSRTGRPKAVNRLGSEQQAAAGHHNLERWRYIDLGQGRRQFLSADDHRAIGLIREGPTVHSVGDLYLNSSCIDADPRPCVKQPLSINGPRAGAEGPARQSERP